MTLAVIGVALASVAVDAGLDFAFDTPGLPSRLKLSIVGSR